MATPELTPFEVVTAIAPLIGGGGLVSAIVAYFAYRAEVSKGRRGHPEHAAMGGITAVMADSESFNKIGDALADVGVAITKFTLLAGNTGQEIVHELHQMRGTMDGVTEEIRKLRRSIEDRPSARSAQQAAQTEGGK